jgi:cytochrome b561
MRQRSLVRYGPVAQAFHWVTAILVVAAFIYGPGGSEERVYSSARDFDRQLHETLGMCVFALVVMRLLWRAVDTRPDPLQVPRWMGIAAKAVQWALYLLLFALPLTAITGA